MSNIAKSTCIRRFMAFVFTVIMVFTTVDYTGFYVYAKEGQGAEAGTDIGGQQDPTVSGQQDPTVSSGDYTGNEFTEESDNGTQLSGLSISIWDMDENADFEIQALAVLNALTKTYDIIDLNYESLQDAVSKDLWNAAVAATDAADKNYEQIRVNFSGGDAAPDECWFFSDVNQMDGDDITQLDMGISLTLSSESNGGATVLLDDDSANLYQYAAESNITFCADAPGRQTVFDAIRTAFGSESSELEIFDGQNNAMPDGYPNGWYDYAADNTFAGVSINGIREFNTGETYTVLKKTYKGDYDTWTEEGGYEFVNLYIHPGNVGKDSFNADEITAILDNYDEKSFDEITVVFCTDTMQGTVSKEIINATLPYLKDSTEDRASQMRISFQNKTTESATEWILSAPQSQTTDQSLSAKLDLEGTKAAVSAASQSLAAGQVNLNFLINKTKDSTSVTKLNTMYGSCPAELALDGTRFLAYMGDDEYNLWLSVDDINQLTAGSTYTISNSFYKGYVAEDDESGDKSLNISYEDAKESLDEEALLAIFEYYGAAEETFEFISITNPETETTVIDKDVVNAAAALLSTRGEQEERPLEFCFKDADSGLIKIWTLINPTANQTQDQTVSSSLTITEDNKVNVSASAPSFSAERYQIRFVHESKNDDFTRLKEIFQFEDSTWNDLCIAGEDINASFVPEADSICTIIYVDSDVTWTADKVYELTVPTYTGRIDNLEDGTKQLTINFWDNDGNDFTEEQLCSILGEYSTEDGIGRIYINRPTAADNNNIIYKSVADKACDLFETTGTLVFVFSDKDTDRFTEWNLHNVGPATSQKANQTVNVGLTTDTSDNSIYFKASSQELVAEDVTVLVGVSRKNDNETADTFIMDIFGEEEKELETEGGEATCWYCADEWNVLFNFDNLSDLNDGEDYKVIEKVYRGDVNVYDENGKTVQNLFISSLEIDEYSFTDESFKTAIQFYKNNNIKFDNIIIEQKLDSSAKFIKKGLINEARQIMKNPNKGIIEFVFCACIPEKTDGEGNIIAERVPYDMNWVIENPGVATSDIDIQTVLELHDGDGGKFRFPNNIYNADNVSINIIIDSTFGMYTDGLVDAFGEAPKQSDPADGVNLIVCEEDDEHDSVIVRTDIGVLYAMDPDSEVVNLIIYNVKGWSTDKNVVNRVLKCDYSYEDLVIPVGQSVQLSLEELGIEGISSVIAESASPDIIEAEMNDAGDAVIIDALKAGERGYIKLSYRDPGKITKLICVTTSLEEPVDIPEIPEIYIVPGVEEKLSDIDLNDIVFGNAEHDGHFEWVNEDADLKSLTDVDFHTFGAIYTDGDGNTANINITVNMIHVEDIELFKVEKDGDTVNRDPLDNISMMKGEKLVIGAEVHFSSAAISSYLENGTVLLVWSTKETLTTASDYFGYKGVDVPRMYEPAKKGKKVFTLSVKSAKTGKILLSKSATVNVNEKELFSFDSPDFVFDDKVDDEDYMKGVYTFYISQQNYENAKKSITIKSGDTNVLKLDKKAKVTPAEGGYEVTIGYSFKKLGKTNITVTAKDEMNSSISYTCERVDYEPKILETSFGIDKTWNTEYGPAAKLTIAYQKDTSAQGKVSLTGDNADKFEVKDGYLVLKDKELKKGKYKVTVNMPVKVPNEATPRTYTKNIEVKISQSAVSATIKQSTKVNEFYKLSAESTEGTGMLKISSGSLKPVNAYIAGDNAVFEIRRIDDSNNFIIALKEDVDLEGEALTEEQKQVTIVSEFEKNGLVCETSKKFSIKTENKAPSLVLSNSKDTLYPGIGCYDTGFEILNKSTKEVYDLSGADIALKGNDGTITLPNRDSVKVGKNNYYAGTVPSYSPTMLIISMDDEECVKATDKFNFSIQLPSWNKPVDVAYSVTVNNTVPKIKLSNKEITLNANEDVYKYQTGKTKIEIKEYNFEPWFIYPIDVEGHEDKFNFEFDFTNFELTVTFKDKVPKGNYKCKVNATVDTTAGSETISADLTIKVVDKSLNNAVKVTKKGSIDILRRETTQIYMNPKFTNLSGEIIDFELKGPDADMFISYYDGETGNCVVKVKTNYLEDGSQEYKYSTKYEYKVVPVYVLKGNGVYVVEGSQQKFKLTQSKPKITVSSDSSILYADKGDDMNFAFSAVSKGEEIAIKEVRLLNYTNDLEWDADNQELSVSDNVKDIKKASGKYTLKFEVVYTDKAGNEKTAQTSYKITIVR